MQRRRDSTSTNVQASRLSQDFTSRINKDLILNRGLSKDLVSTKIIDPVDPSTPIIKQHYFHGGISKDEAMKKLKKQGDFLVRMTVHKDEPKFVISAKWNEEFFNFVVQNDQPKQYYLEGDAFPTIPELISHYYRREPVTVVSGCILQNPITNTEKLNLEQKNIKLEKRIGKGTFGDVFKCFVMEQGNKIEAAAKVCRGSITTKERQRLLRKSRILRKLSHPNLINIIGVSLISDPVTITMELMSRRLDDFLIGQKEKGLGKTAWKSKLGYAFATASAMEFLERSNCCLRDVGAHVWLMDRNETPKTCILKLWRKGGLYRLPVRWIAAESITSRPHIFNNKTDVWSYGVLFWEIICDGELPFKEAKHNSEVMALIKQGTRPKIPRSVPYELDMLIQRCWATDPEARPSFKNILGILERYYKTDDTIDNISQSDIFRSQSKVKSSASISISVHDKN